jgi:poly(hydroxyalkanoate) depolymerase family esterase
MKLNFDGAMRKALALTSRQNLVEATKVIQHALSGGVGGPKTPPAPRDKAAPPSLPPPFRSALPSRPKEAAAAMPQKQAAAPKRQNDSAAPKPPAQGARKAPPIGEVLNLLHKGVVPLRNPGFKPHPRRTPEPPVPQGAQFLSRTYSGAPGSRDYKLFVPSDAKSRADGRGLPLILMLHGCAQNPDDFALGTRMNELAEKRGCLVVYPQQPTSANNLACWNWFNLKDQARDSGEPAILVALTREVMAEFDVDEDRVFVAGLSAGGAMAAILAATYPDVFDAAGIHSGLPYGAAADVGTAFNAMRNGAGGEPALPDGARVRTIVFHGDADRTVHPSNGELIVAAARAGLKAPVAKTQRGRSGSGVPYTRTIIAEKRGAPHIEHWTLDGIGHAWSGGNPDGSYTNPHGPDASGEMLRFFLD